MSFREIYRKTLGQTGYHKDGSQAKVVEHLDTLYNALLHRSDPGYLITYLLNPFRGNKYNKRIKGCYLWGGVGHGKTWLMDLFFEVAPVKSKLRFHFHEFMQHIHLSLSDFKQQKDPLKAVAQSLAGKADLFYVDEFHVSDIADAMLLHGLLDELYRQGVIFVITSNVMPEDLYKNGLQRGRFLPAIELIKNNNQIVQLDGDTDYRLKSHASNSNYYFPLSSNTDSLLEERLYSLAVGEVVENRTININNRKIRTRANAKNIVWFDFDILCGGPRAAVDYIELSLQYNVVIISNIYRMDESHDDLVRRFINLIDAFYDRDVGLIVSATGWPGDLYTGSRFKFEFARTVSRLEDIRSKPLIQTNKTPGDFNNVIELP